VVATNNSTADGGLEQEEQNAPLVLADGTVINPKDGKVVDAPSIEDDSVDYRVRRLEDLPASPKQMVSLCAIAGLKILGLSDYDTAESTGLTEEQVHVLQLTELYERVLTEVVDGAMKRDLDHVRNTFVRESKDAAKKVVSLFKESDSEHMALAAAKDVLDRAGHRPADVIEHRHTVEGGLTIEYVEKKEQDIPLIDVTPEDM
jgi:hypothetical protein